MKRVLVLLASGFEEIEAITVVDVLRRANIDVAIGGVDGAEITGKHGIAVKCDCLLVEVNVNMIDMVVIPGGKESVKILESDTRIINLLNGVYALQKPLGVNSDAIQILSQLNLLPKSLQEHQKGVTESNNIVLSHGSVEAMEFALFLVEKLKSKRNAQTIEQELLAS